MSVAAILDERAVEHTEVAGTRLPLHFGDPAVEYEAAHAAAAICLRAHRALVRVSGADHRRLLNGLLTNEIQALPSGGGCRALFLDTKGHVRGVLELWASEDELTIGCDAPFVDESLADLTKYVLAADARFEDLRATHSVLAVVGPGAAALVAAAGADPPPDAPHAHVTGSIGGVPLGLARTRDSGADGIELHVATEAAAAVWKALEAAGGDDPPPCLGWQVAEAIRIEAGVPRLGAEITGAEFPQEARLDAAVNYEKGCYLGQETVARIHYRGQVNRLLSGFVGDAPVPVGAELISSDQGIGTVTSVATSPRRGPVGLAYVRREEAEAGVTARARLDGEDVAEARVSAVSLDA